MKDTSNRLRTAFKRNSLLPFFADELVSTYALSLHHSCLEDVQALRGVIVKDEELQLGLQIFLRRVIHLLDNV